MTVLEALPVPSVRALGPELGALTGRMMTEAGIDLRCGVQITGFVGEGLRVGVALADGTQLDADVAVVGIGGVPRLDWIEGVATPNGLACGPTGRVEGLPGVWAVGDVAAWADPTHGDRHRHEHWTSAGDQAASVARDILGEPPPPAPVPYFWSDQFGLKIQLIGRPEHADGLLPLHGDGLAGGAVKGTVVGMLAGDRLVAVAGFGAARFVVRYRALLQAQAGRAEALEQAAELTAPAG